MHGNVRAVKADLFVNEAGEDILTVTFEFIDGPYEGQETVLIEGQGQMMIGTEAARHE